MCLRREATAVGYLLHGFIRSMELQLYFLYQSIVNDGLGSLTANALRHLCQVSRTHIQSIGIIMHVAIRPYVLLKRIDEVMPLIMAGQLNTLRLDEYKKVLTEKGAEIINEEAWGLKKMAYAIQKKSTGFYCLIEFKAEPEVIKTLETAFRRDEKVIRFQTVKLDKYAAEYAEKRRAKLGKKEEA